MPKSLLRFAVPAGALILIVALVALLAGWQYAIVALILGIAVIGGLATGIGVAGAEEAPFEPDEETAAGDTPQLSESERALAPRRWGRR